MFSFRLYTSSKTARPQLIRFYQTRTHITLFSPKLLSCFPTALPLLPYCVKVHRRALIPHSPWTLRKNLEFAVTEAKVSLTYSLLDPTHGKGEGAPNLILHIPLIMPTMSFSPPGSRTLEKGAACPCSLQSWVPGMSISWDVLFQDS